jgi:hypothetical protein
MIAVTGVVLCLALTSCHGPVSTHAVTIEADCAITVGGGPATTGPATLHLSVGSSSFATPGAAVTFPSLTLDGEPVAPLAGPVGVFVYGTGLATFPNQPHLPPWLAGLVPAESEFMGSGAVTSTDFGSNGTTITGAAGSTAAIDLAAVILSGEGPTDFGVCTPQAGQSARLASISIIDGGGH